MTEHRFSGQASPMNGSKIATTRTKTDYHNMLQRLVVIAVIVVLTGTTTVEAFINTAHYSYSITNKIQIHPAYHRPLPDGYSIPFPTWVLHMKDINSDQGRGTNNEEATSSSSSSTMDTIPDDAKSVSTTKSSELSVLDSVQDMINRFDVSSLSNIINIDQLRKNIVGDDGDELGSRGEGYFVAQALVAFCILYGGVPVVGDTLSFFLGPVLLVTGLSVLAWGIVDLNDSLTIWPVPAKNAELKTTGIYEQLRHPMYAGLVAAAAGLAIVTGSANRLLLTAILYYICDVKTNVEEDALIQTYGTAYQQYQQDVPTKFVPMALLNQLPWMKSSSTTDTNTGSND